MSEREEVKREFRICRSWCNKDGEVTCVDSACRGRLPDADAMAEEIVQLRSQLREREQEVFAARVDKDFAERERDEARRERDSFEAMAKAWKDHADSVVAELVALRTRAERAERVVEAVAGLAEADVINGGEYFDDICVQPVLAAYHRYALDAAEGANA